MSVQIKSAIGSSVRVYLCGGCNRVHISMGSTELSVDPVTFSALYQQMNKLIGSCQQEFQTSYRSAIPQSQRH